MNPINNLQCAHGAFVAILSAMVFAAPGAATARAEVYPNGMISYWTFDDGTAKDVLGRNDGEIVGTPVVVPGKVGLALRLNGVSDGIVVPNSVSLNPAQITMEVWVNYITYQTAWFSRRNMILDKRVGAVGSYDLAYNGYRDPGNTGGWESNLNINNVWDYYIQGVTTQISTNTWYHVVQTFDGSTVRQYQNGVLVRSWPKTGVLSPSDVDLKIGKPGHILDSYSNAVIDEVALYDRALTAAEIEKHYLKGLNGLGYVQTITVQIDVKPGGGNPSPINLHSRGKVPIAIYGSATFDVTGIDLSTVRFAAASPILGMTSFEDVNSDGFVDVVLHFRTQDLALSTGDKEECLTGTTLKGQDFAGCAALRVRKD